MTLVGFLRARIADDENAARAVPPFAKWESTAYGERFLSAESDHSQADTMFVDRFNPARILAECEAKRRIIEEWAAADRAAGSYPGTDAGIAMGLELAVALLALPYADHPDYDERWRP